MPEGKERLVIPITKAFHEPEELKFEDFYFQEPSKYFREPTEEQTARYWELKKAIAEKLFGKEKSDG